MQQYKKILVIIDPSQQKQAALDRAVHISKAQSNNKLHLFLAIFDLSYELSSMFSQEEQEAMHSALILDRKKWLTELIAPYKQQGINFDIEVVWHKRPFEAIIEHCLKHQHDLVIKSTHEHPKLSSIIFTPTDWHLLRKCPASLLLVKEHTWPKNGKIIVAVNCVEDNVHHQSLNDKLIEHSKAMAQLLEGQLFLVNAYPSLPINLSLELPEFDAENYSEIVKTNHKNQLDNLAKKHGFNSEQVKLIEGQAEYAIADYACKTDAELVVLGTIGRSGFSAAIIGNTAEHIIDQLECDLLAIKPEGYQSPYQSS